MQMTDDEIRRRYKDADNKPEIIQILAELNACPVCNIKMIVGDKKTPVTYELSKDERLELYQQLYDQGKTDNEIAESGGVSQQAIRNWRKKNNLLEHKAKKEKKTRKYRQKKETVTESMKPYADCHDVEELERIAKIDRPEDAVEKSGIEDIYTKNTYEKPPLGLRPSFIWKEARLTEILEAAHRYVEAKKDIPFLWIKEYIEILIELDNRETA